MYSMCREKIILTERYIKFSQLYKIAMTVLCRYMKHNDFLSLGMGAWWTPFPLSHYATISVYWFVIKGYLDINRSTGKYDFKNFFFDIT